MAYSLDLNAAAVGMPTIDPLLLALAAARTAFSHTVENNPSIFGGNMANPLSTESTPYHQTPLSLFNGNPFLPIPMDTIYDSIALPTHPAPATLNQSQTVQNAPQTPSPVRQQAASSQKRMSQSDDGMQPPAKKRIVSLAVNQEAAPPSSTANFFYFTPGSGSTSPIPETETRSRMDSSSVGDVGSEDDEPGTKRSAHREVEKKRRDDLKTYLTQLQQLVPGLRTPGARTHHSKVTVVRCAVEHIRELHERARTREKEMEALRREVASLRANQQQK